MSIAIENVSFTYAAGTPCEVEALHQVCLTMRDGEFVGLMGHTGCGKTTLIQLIAGLETPLAGRILLDGADINEKRYDRSILRKTVGIVFQYPEYQLFETTVEKDVAFGLKYSDLSQPEVASRVQWALSECGFDFEKIRTQSPLALSGGEKRRVAIAGVLAAKPRVLMFDEPIAGLDPLGRQAFIALVMRLNREGVTVLMASHNADALCACARRIVVLDRGRIVADGETKAVFSDVRRMDKLRLGVSAPRRAADALLKRGIPIRQDAVRYDELLSALMETFGEGGA